MTNSPLYCICAAYSVLKFVRKKTTKNKHLLFHTFSFVGFKGILITLRDTVVGLVLKVKLSI